MVKGYLEAISGQYSIDSIQKNYHTRNITHHKESATICDLKPELWGLSLAQRTGERKPVIREHIRSLLLKVQALQQ
jgi:hypothetical protein